MPEFGMAVQKPLIPPSRNICICYRSVQAFSYYHSNLEPSRVEQGPESSLPIFEGLWRLRVSEFLRGGLEVIGSSLLYVSSVVGCSGRQSIGRTGSRH